MRAFPKYIVLFFSCFFALANAYATHFKAGVLTGKRLSIVPNTFQFTLTIYLDSTSVYLYSTAFNDLHETYAVIDFGDGTTSSSTHYDSEVSIGNNTLRNIYTFTHTYGNSASAFFAVSYGGDNRNQYIRNISNSVQVPFYIQTLIYTNPLIGTDNLPQITNPPIDVAMAGQLFTYNPGVYDTNGDSISYALGTPYQAANSNVPGYQTPGVFGGSFTIDSVTGTLTWNVPPQPIGSDPVTHGDLYNFAILIYKWRNDRVIGVVEIDMQLLVLPAKNKPPVLTIPPDTCVVAGTLVTKNVYATDPNGFNLSLTATGGPFAVTSPSSPATFKTTSSAPGLATGQFNWQTNCNEVRQQPYQVTFRVQNYPGNGIDPLTDYKTMQITVLAPQPESLAVSNSASGNGFVLSWQRYSCANADSIEIYRKECSSGNNYSPCQQGISETSGYTFVASVPVNQTSYTDSSVTSRIAEYCYVLVATFPSPGLGKSIPSDEACGGLSINVPVIAMVSVTATDSVNGKIALAWYRPLEDTTSFQQPYSYSILRSDSSEASFTTIATNLSDTTYTDSLLNTVKNQYTYKILFYYGTPPVYSGSSDPASSVFLSGSSGGSSATLNWTAMDPWNANGLYQLVYRAQKPGSFAPEDSLIAAYNMGEYVDNTVIKGDTFCYYIETRGKYCRSELNVLLKNTSERVCIIPHDTARPCPPDLFLKPLNCDTVQTANNYLHWVNDTAAGCNRELKSYNLYFADYENEPLQLLASAPDTFYVDTDTISTAGCYEVTAVNFYGVESPPSNKVCKDICVYYALPNVITPNGDGKNDFFVPFNYPLNVQKVTFFVYNRWGAQVYYNNTDINIHWNGRDTQGNPLADGVYYYLAEVTYKRRLNPKDQNTKLKGWVQILDELKQRE